MAYKWEPWPSAPKLYIDLKHDRKSIATIRRIQTPKQKAKDKWGTKWMVVTRFTCRGGMPGSYGIVFPTMKAAKEYVEGRL